MNSTIITTKTTILSGIQSGDNTQPQDQSIRLHNLSTIKTIRSTVHALTPPVTVCFDITLSL